MGYWVAKHQVKIEIEAREHRDKQRALILVANTIDEFFRVFYSAVKEIAHVERAELQSHPEIIDPHIAEIDNLVTKTGILGRLAHAIDGLSATGFAGLPEDIVTRPGY